jgi:hypothetical protein
MIDGFWINDQFIAHMGHATAQSVTGFPLQWPSFGHVGFVANKVYHLGLTE